MAHDDRTRTDRDFLDGRLALHGLWTRKLGLVLWPELKPAHLRGEPQGLIPGGRDLDWLEMRILGNTLSQVAPRRVTPWQDWGETLEDLVKNHYRYELVFQDSEAPVTCQGASLDPFRTWRLLAGKAVYTRIKGLPARDPRMCFGPDLVFLGAVLDDIHRLVHAGHVVPAVRRIGKGDQVRWTLPSAADDWVADKAREALRGGWFRTPERAIRHVGLELDVKDFISHMVHEATVQSLKGLRKGKGVWAKALKGSDPVPPDSSEVSSALASWCSRSSLTVPEGPRRTLVLSLEAQDPPKPAGEPEKRQSSPREQPPAHEQPPSVWTVDTLLRNGDGTLEGIAHRGEVDPDLFRQAVALRRGAADAYPRLLGWPLDDAGLRFTLTEEMVLDLLDRGVERLGARSVEVLLPKMLIPGTIRPTARFALKEIPEGDGEGGLKALAEFNPWVTLGDTVVSLQEFTQAMKRSHELVRIRNSWVRVEPSAARKLAAFLKRATPPEGEVTVGQVLGLLREAAQEGIDTPGIVAGGDFGLLFDTTRSHALQPVGQPAGLKADLRHYQRAGVDWLAFMNRMGLGVILADDMGLGKTIQLISLLLHEREAHPRPGPTLIVCPMSVVSNWEREITKFAPSLSVYVHHGPGRLTGEKLVHRAADVDVVLTTYTLLSRDVRALGQIQWDRVALDEAQKIKNIETAQSRAAKSLTARHKVALTGTPVENRLLDLYSIMEFVNPGIMGPQETFLKQVAEPIEGWRDENVSATLRAFTEPFILRRLKTDPDIVPDLPAKEEITVRANLTLEQAAMYQEIVRDLLSTDLLEGSGIPGRNRLVRLLATITRLKQICNHPAMLGEGSRSVLDDRGRHRSGKMEVVDGLVENALEVEEKMLVFTQFVEFGKFVVPYWEKKFNREVPLFHGGLSKRKRLELEAAFQDPDGPPLMVVSLHAGGTGLNLTAANHVVHLDRWWNPAVEDQATDRAYRIGQDKDVQVHKLVCAGTIEQRIDDVLEGKKIVAGLAVTSGQEWLNQLDNRQLRELLALSPDAVGD